MIGCGRVCAALLGILAVSLLCGSAQAEPAWAVEISVETETDAFGEKDAIMAVGTRFRLVAVAVGEMPPPPNAVVKFETSSDGGETWTQAGPLKPLAGGRAVSDFINMDTPGRFQVRATPLVPNAAPEPVFRTAETPRAKLHPQSRIHPLLQLLVLLPWLVI